LLTRMCLCHQAV